MLSVVVYGRNDSYGYNLHKRAALGLNCIAGLLQDPDDELLFVDYNTPDDFPTFPEAIADTLTAQARRVLRIFRVRPAVHARFSGRTHLKALEPVARNVAVRRSSPRNRWILSTNTDMIFVPRRARTLGAIVRDLPAGYYHLPRFELPESLWEGFDRHDAEGVIAAVEAYGRSLWLNDVVCADECVKYDNPGDFQLLLRDDLFAIDGFNEEMLLGWHVDSNIAKRLFLRYGWVGDLAEELLGYHCEHTRQVTAAHEQKAVSNDVNRFCTSLTQPDLPAQRETWGCPADAVEEIRLEQSVHRRYLDAMAAARLEQLPAPPARNYTLGAPAAQYPYDARHTLPFLVDAMAAMAPGRVGWIGGRADSLWATTAALAELGTRDVLFDRWALWLVGDLPPGVAGADLSTISRDATVLVIDFGAPSASVIGPAARRSADADGAFEEFVQHRFTTLALDEAARQRAGAAPRRVVCVDALWNRYDAMVRASLVAATAPFSSRVRYGAVTPAMTRSYAVAADFGPRDEDRETHRTVDLLPRLEVEAGGQRAEDRVVAPLGRRGYLGRVPLGILPPGEYRLEATLRRGQAVGIGAVIIDVVIGADRVASTRGRFPVGGTAVATFTVPRQPSPRGAAEVRIFRGRWAEFELAGLALTRLAPPLPTGTARIAINAHVPEVPVPSGSSPVEQ